MGHPESGRDEEEGGRPGYSGSGREEEEGDRSIRGGDGEEKEGGLEEGGVSGEWTGRRRRDIGATGE